MPFLKSAFVVWSSLRI